MTTQAATVDAVHLVSEAPNGVGDSTYGVRRVYLFSCSFPAYTGSSDNAKISGVAAALVTAGMRDGRTITWEANAVQALCAAPGQDAAASPQSVYAGTFAVSSADLTFNLTDATGTELTSTTGTTSGVQIYVAVDAL